MYITAKGGRCILQIRLSDWWLLTVFNYLLHSCNATKLHFSITFQLLSLLLARCSLALQRLFSLFFRLSTCEWLRPYAWLYTKFGYGILRLFVYCLQMFYMFTVSLLLAISLWRMFYGLKLFIYGFRCFKPLT